MKNKKKILSVSAGPNLIDPKTGTDNRLHNLAIQLSKKNEIVALISEEHVKRSSNNLLFKVYGFKMGSSPYLTDLNINFFITLLRILRNEQINVILIAFPRGIITSKLLCRLLGLDILIVYDAQNFESLRAKEVKYSNLPFYKKIIAPIYVPIVERIAVKLVDHVISVSHEDKELFIKKYNTDTGKITVIPSGTNIINLKSLKDRDEVRGELDVEPEEVVIVFHGTYTYYTNKEAIDLIIGYIAPKIERLYDNVKFIVAGKDVPRLEDKNIKFVGFVENLHSLLNASDIAIVPLLHGGGTKLKILDYMGLGLPIVTTKKGIEGINAKNGEHAIIVDDINEKFINAIKYLINNKEERERLGANARRLAEEEYDWNKIGEKLDKLYRRILEEKKHVNK